GCPQAEGEGAPPLRPDEKTQAWTIVLRAASITRIGPYLVAVTTIVLSRHRRGSAKLAPLLF
ncbi:MAG: hypothetical protein WDO18_03035, partial [Acidobacteriota bacterium]